MQIPRFFCAARRRTLSCLLLPAAALLALNLSSCKRDSAGESVVEKEEAAKRPDPERFESAMVAFDKETPPPASAKGGIVFTGSSSIRLWKLQNAFSDLPVLNRGFGGSVANDLIHYADRAVLRYEPKLVVIYTGSNDINAKLTLDECFDDFTDFLNLVHEKLPDTRVIVNPVKISRKRIEQMEKVHKLNDRLQKWCAENPWTRWVDTGSYLADENGQPLDKYFAKDQLHLNAEGYAEWEKIIEPVIREEWAKVSGASEAVAPASAQ